MIKLVIGSFFNSLFFDVIRSNFLVCVVLTVLKFNYSLAQTSTVNNTVNNATDGLNATKTLSVKNNTDNCVCRVNEKCDFGVCFIILYKYLRSNSFNLTLS
jgi:hypothetical protein